MLGLGFHLTKRRQKVSCNFCEDGQKRREPFRAKLGHWTSSRLLDSRALMFEPKTLWTTLETTIKFLFGDNSVPQKRILTKLGANFSYTHTPTHAHTQPGDAGHTYTHTHARSQEAQDREAQDHQEHTHTHTHTHTDRRTNRQTDRQQTDVAGLKHDSEHRLEG